MIKFTLMNKNKKIFDFDYDIDECEIVRIDRKYPDNEKYAPFGLIKDNNLKNNFNKWWKNRQIPASREGIKDILINNNYNSDSFDLLNTKSYCLSLSDQYWVKEVNDDILWEDINFFDNDFSLDIGDVFLNVSKESFDLNLNSPDMTSNGNYPKRWKIINGDRCLIKSGGKIINQEPFNEVIATKLYDRILNDGEYVRYNIINVGNRKCCFCKDFITRDTELIPAWKINENFDNVCDEDKYSHYIRCLDELNISNGRMLIDKMIVCDFILANKDRHFNNFGVIRNVNTLEFVGVAPIYDNGCSLWYDENDMYVGEFFLTKPFLEYEKMQIGLVKDFSWLDINLLDGFLDDVREILSLNELITKKRIDKIVNEIEIRINYIKNLMNNYNGD